MWKLSKTKRPKQKNLSKILVALEILTLDILVCMNVATSAII